jgi:hypothetical protein
VGALSGREEVAAYASSSTRRVPHFGKSRPVRTVQCQTFSPKWVLRGWVIYPPYPIAALPSLFIQERIFQVASTVMFRGLQYYKILEDEEASSFPHPLRQQLLAGQVTDHYTLPEDWSWRRYLATCIEQNEMRREPEAIMQIIADIRSRVGLQEATWFDI